jgi:hypothetical protein
MHILTQLIFGELCDQRVVISQVLRFVGAWREMIQQYTMDEILGDIFVALEELIEHRKGMIIGRKDRNIGLRIVQHVHYLVILFEQVGETRMLRRRNHFPNSLVRVIMTI